MSVEQKDYIVQCVQRSRCHYRCIYSLLYSNCTHNALPELRSSPIQSDLYHAKNVLAPGIICAYSTAKIFFFFIRATWASKHFFKNKLVKRYKKDRAEIVFLGILFSSSHPPKHDCEIINYLRLMWIYYGAPNVTWLISWTEWITSAECEQNAFCDMLKQEIEHTKNVLWMWSRQGKNSYLIQRMSILWRKCIL